MPDLCLCLISVSLSLPLFPLCTGCQQQSPQLLHHDRAPPALCPPPAPSPAHGRTSPGARPAASGDAGVARPRASLLCLAANPNVNPKENPIYSHVSLGKAGASQPSPKPHGAAPAELWGYGCLWIYLLSLGGKRGCFGLSLPFVC